MPEAFLHVDRLVHAYREGERRLPVLRGASLILDRGEALALLGRSGCGKSTLLNLIGGVDLPDSGAVRVNGTELTALTERERSLFRRRHIGFIYQFFNLIPTLSALENVSLVLELNGGERRESARRSEAMLEAVGLAARGEHFPEQLSGGEQQRVAIARALVHRPSLVLADEPTGNLDAGSGEQVLGLLRELCERGGSALLLVTHSLAVARRADRLLVLDDGGIGEGSGDFAW